MFLNKGVLVVIALKSTGLPTPAVRSYKLLPSLWQHP